MPEAALVASASEGGVDPNIRSQVNTDTRVLADKDNTFIDSLIFWHDKPPPAWSSTRPRSSSGCANRRFPGSPRAADADHRAAQARPVEGIF